MDTATLTILLAQVRQLADVEAFTARYPDATITTWINQGIVAYRELLGGNGSRVLRTHVERTLSTDTLSAWTIVEADCCSITACDPTGEGSEEQVVDGVLAVDGTRVLCTGESVLPAENGVWVAHKGAWTRAPDYAAGMSSLVIIVHVRGGTVRRDTWWVDTNSTGIIGTSELALEERNAPPSAGKSYVSLAGLSWTRIRSVFARENDSESWYQVHEAANDRDLGTHDQSRAGRPVTWWVDGVAQLMRLSPPTDRERSVRIVYEPSVPALSSGPDEFQSLIPRGVEFVATFAALKLLARDQNQEGYTLLNAEFAKCEQSIKSKVRDFTGGTRRRRDSRGQRERDQNIGPVYVWPDYP